MESDLYLVATVCRTFFRHLHAFLLTSYTLMLLISSGEKFEAQKIQVYLPELMKIGGGLFLSWG